MLLNVSHTRGTPARLINPMVFIHEVVNGVRTDSELILKTPNSVTALMFIVHSLTGECHHPLLSRYCVQTCKILNGFIQNIISGMHQSGSKTFLSLLGPRWTKNQIDRRQVNGRKSNLILYVRTRNPQTHGNS